MKTQDTGLRATPGRAPRVSPAAEDLPEEAVVIDGHREAEEGERSGDNEEDKGERSGPGSEAQGWASRQPPQPSKCGVFDPQLECIGAVSVDTRVCAHRQAHTYDAYTARLGY